MTERKAPYKAGYMGTNKYDDIRSLLDRYAYDKAIALALIDIAESLNKLRFETTPIDLGALSRHASDGYIATDQDLEDIA